MTLGPVIIFHNGDEQGAAVLLGCMAHRGRGGGMTPPPPPLGSGRAASGPPLVREGRAAYEPRVRALKGSRSRYLTP